ncbi:MAG: hypothetical protein AB7N76_18280 [Planctomycetota bacterium]
MQTKARGVVEEEAGDAPLAARASAEVHAVAEDELHAVGVGEAALVAAALRLAPGRRDAHAHERAGSASPYMTPPLARRAP